MEIIFEAKEILEIVDGTLLQPFHGTTIIFLIAEQEEECTWDLENAKGRMLISQSISQKVLDKLNGLHLASAMWKKLDQLYLKKSPKNLFILQGKFFDYKMTAMDNIASHVQHVNEMAVVLANLGNARLLLCQIICSLRSSYNNVITTWSNVHSKNRLWMLWKIG